MHLVFLPCIEILGSASLLRRVLGRCALACLLAAFGCRGSSSEPRGKILNVGNRSEVQDLDPHLVTGIAEFRALGALFEGLVNLDPASLKPIPGVAERWEVSADALHYRFYLRENARWSNGDPVTAEDFVYAWQRMLSPALGAEYAYLLHCLKNAKDFNEGRLQDFSEVGVKAVSPHLLDVFLENPVPYFLSMQIHFAWFPVHRGTIERFGSMTQRGSPWTRPENHVGNGPFRVAAWKPDEVLAVERNPYYWDAARVRLDGVRFYPISNELTEERLFRSGRLHITYTVPMFRIDAYRREQPNVLQIHPYLQSYFYRFNVTRAPFQDERVRQAFSYAIDRKALAEEVWKAGEQPAYCLTPPNTNGYTCRTRVPYDPERAQQLLAAAGFPEGKGFPHVQLLYNTAETDRIVAEAVQQMWRRTLGVQVELVNQEYKVYLSSMSNLEYDIARSTWLGDVYDPVNFLECFLSTSGNNRTGFASPEFDAYIEQAYKATDAAVREEALQQAESMLLTHAVIAPVAFMTQKFLMAENVRGYAPNLLGYFAWRDMDIATEFTNP